MAESRVSREEINVYEHASFIFERMNDGGCLLVAMDKQGRANPMTIGWWLLGPFYEGHAISAVAVKPQRYTFRPMEESDEYVIAVPGKDIRPAVDFCGTKSGRDCDKWKETGLTPIPSVNVLTPSIKECPINIECSIYHRERPPHMILTPAHRREPTEQQHTIYFSKILAAYKHITT